MRALLLPAGLLVGFLAFAAIGERRQWRYPTIAAFAVWWLIGAAIAYARSRGLTEPTAEPHEWSAERRGSVVMLVGITLYLGAVAAAFTLTARRSLSMRCLVSALIAVPAAVLAIAGVLYAGCMAGLGCI